MKRLSSHGDDQAAMVRKGTRLDDGLRHATLSIAAMLAAATSAPAVGASYPAELELRLLTPEQGRVFSGSAAGAGFGSRMRPLGDIDGDGYDDVIIGEDPSATSGRTWLVFGSGSHAAAIPGSDGADADFVEINDGFEFARAGDWTGDGIDDWLSRSGSAQFTLIAGSRSRPSSPLDIDLLGAGTSAAIVDSTSPALDYSQRVLPVGDFDGDGRDDLVVMRQDPPNFGLTRLLLLPGADGTLPGRLDLSAVAPEQQGIVRYVHSENVVGSELFSSYIDFATGGDLNGDGLGDIVLGMNEAYDRDGLVYVLFGNAGGTIPDIGPGTLDGRSGFAAVSGEARSANQRNSNTGREVRILPDADGDGIDELLVSSNSHVYVIHGRSDEWPAELDLDEPGDGAGYRVEVSPFELGVAGDLNDDGLGDWWYAVENSIGVIYGSSDRTAPGSLATDAIDGFSIRGTLQFDRRLEAAEHAGDIDGDGIDDLLVSSPFAIGQAEPAPWLLDPVAELRSPRVGLVTMFAGLADQGLPASPFALRALLGPDLVEIRWEPSRSPDIVSYELSRNGLPLGSSLTDAPGALLDPGADRDALLDYALVAVDALGQRSSAARLLVVNTEQRYPELGGEVWSDSFAELFWAWDNVRYRVYRDGLQVDELTATSWLDHGYTPAGHDYVIEVPAKADTRTSLRSATLRLPEDAGKRPPQPPRNLSFTLEGDTRVHLVWSAADNANSATSYEISRDDDVLAVVASTTFIDAGLDAFASQANYSIRAIDSNGLASSPLRLYADLALARRESRPAEAANLSSIVYSATALELFWSTALIGPPPARFEVRRDGELLGATTGRSWFEENLQSNTRYTYAVTSVDAAGTRSAATSIAVSTPGPPRAPATIRTDVYGPNLVEVFWARSIGATPVHRYELYRDGQRIATHYGLSWMDDALSSATTYRYTVRAVTFSGVRSALSPVAEATTRER